MRFLSDDSENISAALQSDLDIVEMTDSLLDELTQGNFTLEFFI
jgi:hypothetical protein